MAHGDQGDNVGQRFKSVADLLASVSVLAGSVLYFGWVRTTAFFDYFGLDESLFGFSTQDYLLRSTEVLFRPALCLLAVSALGLFFLAFINGMIETLHRRALQRWVLVPTTVGGLMLLSIAFLGLNEFAPALLAAVCLGLSSFVLFCSLKIMSAIYTTDKARWALNFKQSAAVLAGMTFLGALFWATTVYAHQVGSSLASFIAQNPKGLSQAVPQVVLYSRFPLDPNDQTGVIESELPGPAGAMNYRYTGYRLLIYSNSRWFLIPSTWSDSGPNSTSVLIDDGSIRVTICYHGCGRL
jgi:hypothetical protein